MIIAIGSDHAGWEMKEDLRPFLERMGHEIRDLGTNSPESVDYPDYAEKVAVAVARGRNKKGILGCGTGIGAAITANKIPGALAALVHNPRTARLSVEHDNANILVLAGRPYSKKKVARIVKSWLTSEFQGGRHLRRVKKIRRLERKYQ